MPPHTTRNPCLMVPAGRRGWAPQPQLLALGLTLTSGVSALFLFEVGDF